MNKKGIMLIVIVAVALLALVALFWGQYNSSNQSDETKAPGVSPSKQQPSNTEPTSQQDYTKSVTIVYGENGFLKPTLEVDAGDTITVRNGSDSVLDFASDDHPTHQKQSELNIGEIAPGESKTFIMDTKGTWGYHNHENAAHTGILVVK